MSASKENRTNRFKRVAEARTNKIINMLRLLGNCADTRNYEYTSEQYEHIFTAIQNELDKAKSRYISVPKKTFKFSLKENLKINIKLSLIYDLPHEQVNVFKQKVFEYIQEKYEESNMAYTDISDEFIANFLQTEVAEIVALDLQGEYQCGGINCDDYFKTISLDYYGEDVRELVRECAERIVEGE